MNVKELLKKTQENNQGLLITNQGTSKESIYKKEIFDGLNDNEKKRARIKIRKQVDSIFASIIAAKKENKKDAVSKLAKNFAEFYKEAYQLNDYSFASIASENKKNKDLVNNALEIIKSELKIK